MIFEECAVYFHYSRCVCNAQAGAPQMVCQNEPLPRESSSKRRPLAVYAHTGRGRRRSLTKPTNAKMPTERMKSVGIFAYCVSCGCKFQLHTSVYAPSFAALLPCLERTETVALSRRFRQRRAGIRRIRPGWSRLPKAVARLLSGFFSVWQSVDFVNALRAG